MDLVAREENKNPSSTSHNQKATDRPSEVGNSFEFMFRCEERKTYTVYHDPEGREGEREQPSVQ